MWFSETCLDAGDYGGECPISFKIRMLSVCPVPSIRNRSLETRRHREFPRKKLPLEEKAGSSREWPDLFTVGRRPKCCLYGLACGVLLTDTHRLSALVCGLLLHSHLGISEEVKT